MMYSGSGYAIELLSGKPWEQFVRDRILSPLGMSNTTFTIEDMVKGPEPGVPYTERRDNTELYAIPGTYETLNGGKFDVVLRPDGTLAIQYAGGTFQNLIPWQPRRFRIKEFPDVVFEFVLANGRVTELRQTDPGGEYKFVRK